MTIERINIVFAVDGNYINQLAATIVSILLNSEIEDEFSFFVLDNGISDKQKEKILELRKFKNFAIYYINLDGKSFEKYPIASYEHISLATYFRLLLPSVLGLDKVLYIDCDVFVRKSLKELYNIDISDSYAAVVEDMVQDKAAIQLQLKKLGLRRYFNAGVILFNLKKMRDDLVQQKCIDFANEQKLKIKFHDQCILNAVFNENVKFIDKKYNFQHNEELGGLNRLYSDNKVDIVILHFVGPAKPWLHKKMLQFRLEYGYYLSKTEFGPKFWIFLMKEILYFNFDIFKKLKKTFKNYT